MYDLFFDFQGEGAPTVRKGTCANHIRDVGNLFSGAHLTLHARTEEDVEPQLIIDKIAKAGSAYSFKTPRSETGGQVGPVGTTYQRVIPGIFKNFYIEICYCNFLTLII